MRWPWSSPPWRARPTSSSAGAGRLRPLHDAREYDAVVASGEQVTAGLLAIVLQDMGVSARSWQGWQLPIRTDGRARRGAHLEIDGEELIEAFPWNWGRSR
jgi:aspartokinase